MTGPPVAVRVVATMDCLLLTNGIAMIRLVTVSAAMALVFTGGGGEGQSTCICTPIDDVTRTVTVTVTGTCSEYQATESSTYSSCIESSAAGSPLGPTIALRVLSDPVWNAPWPHNGSRLPSLESAIEFAAR